MKRRDFVLNASTVVAVTGAAASSEVSAGSLDDFTDNRREIATSRCAGDILDPAYIDTRIDSRSVSFENPTGARGAGGKKRQGRKGSPLYILDPGERIVLAHLNGPGTIRHIWTMLCNLPPEVGRALRFEVFYDGLNEPSISVPFLDFFGLPHGRVAEYYSALISVHEGRGFNAYIPMPFAQSVRMELTNESTRHVMLFYQIDYTLESSILGGRGYLHVTFRRENPTLQRRDFVIADGLAGPGRFLGCAVGIRVIDDGPWYGEGEVKIYRDGDKDFPTYCGTGLEDYVGSAYGLGHHYGHYSGSPIQIPVKLGSSRRDEVASPYFVGFYRWHVPDPIMFATELRVTIQQIGLAVQFRKAQEAEFANYRKTHLAAGPGWMTLGDDSLVGGTLVERSDDYCAAAFTYCSRPQAVTRFETATAVRDIELLPSERSASALSVSEQEDKAIREKQYWNGDNPAITAK